MSQYRNFTLTHPRRRASEQSNTCTENQIPKIPRSVPTTSPNESPLGGFLIRLILCTSIFSLILLMKNSADPVVSIAYNTIEAWTVCNYSIPEEYNLEKFVSAIKTGDFASVFSSASYPQLMFPTVGSISLKYGETTPAGAQCFGIMISADAPCDIFAPSAGTVADIGENATFGKYIVIQAPDGTKIIYGCCSDILVTKGDSVDTATVVAQLSRGDDGSYHMYMEVQANGITVNPEKCFDKEGNL